MPHKRTVVHSLYENFAGPLAALVLMHAVGTIGYRIIGGAKYSLLDCLYMTFITIATIGYGEVVDVSHSVPGRLFTMFIGTVGIGLVYYMLARMTMFLVAGEINVAMRRRKMLKRIGALTQHYIVCGVGRVGSNVAHELSITDRPYVIIDTDLANIEKHRDRFPDAMWLQGDASEDDVLKLAGIEHAAGVFAITGDDSKNLVITLSAKQLNAVPRVVARCHDVNYIDKIRKVGADAIVSPDFTGGMRIVSSMVRPHVVGFLDEMLRSDNTLRVEEVHVPNGAPDRTLTALGLAHREFIILAVRSGERWHFNPEGSHTVRGSDTLIAMATPHGRALLEKVFAG
ncbi:MAG: potassium channel protein [Proteobacteria bacterium]|nr:potassium channel protein [Pseudomonadota bacterium]